LERVVSTSDRRVVASLVAALGLLWGALAISNLDHAVAYFGGWFDRSLIVFIAVLPMALFVVAAAGLWVGKRWAWTVAALAMLVLVGLVGYAYLAVYGSSD